MVFNDGGDLHVHQNVSFEYAIKTFFRASRMFARQKEKFERNTAAGYKYMPNYTFEWRSLLAGHTVTMTAFMASLVAGINEN